MYKRAVDNNVKEIDFAEEETCAKYITNSVLITSARPNSLTKNEKHI